MVDEVIDREAGNYWVNVTGQERDWQIAWWWRFYTPQDGVGGSWLVFDGDTDYSDDEFVEIDEQRIER